MIHTLDAHIALDDVVGIHQRLRELLAAAQKGEYTSAAFVQSYRGILADFDFVDLCIALEEVSEQLKD